MIIDTVLSFGVSFRFFIRAHFCGGEGHIGGMDTFARGLISAARILEENIMPAMVASRYSSFDSGFGQRFEAGQLTLEDCEAYAVQQGEPRLASGEQEKYEMLLNRYCR